MIALIVVLSAAIIVSFTLPVFAQVQETAESVGFIEALREIPVAIKDGFVDLKDDIYSVLIEDDNYKHITNGLGVTLEITFFALQRFQHNINIGCCLIHSNTSHMTS